MYVFGEMLHKTVDSFHITAGLLQTFSFGFLTYSIADCRSGPTTRVAIPPNISSIYDIRSKEDKNSTVSTLLYSVEKHTVFQHCGRMGFGEVPLHNDNRKGIPKCRNQNLSKGNKL